MSSAVVGTRGAQGILYLCRTDSALAVLTDPLVRYRKPLVVATCLLFSFIILMLASLAFLDIRERRRQRDALALQNAYLSALHDTAIGLTGDWNSTS